MQAIGHRHRKTKRWEAAVWAVLLGMAHLAEAAPDPRVDPAGFLRQAVAAACDGADMNPEEIGRRLGEAILAQARPSPDRQLPVVRYG